MNFTDLTKNGIITIENLFTEEDLKIIYWDILKVKEYRQFKDSKIGKITQLEQDIRNDQIFWLNENNPSNLAQKICVKKLTLIKDELNKQFFLGLKSFEAHYAFYEKGNFYKRHLDRFNTDKKRVISFILYLNRYWKPGHGGELNIYSDWKSEVPIKTINPTWGKVVLFLSDEVIHEVAVANQPRLSLAAWFRRDSLF